MGQEVSRQETLTQTREHYVIENRSLVHYVAQKNLHIPQNTPYYEDCIQEGTYGLILASIRFNESSGNEFSTYAVPYIRGYIQRFLREFMRSPIKFPRRFLDAIPVAAQMEANGSGKDEIAASTGLSLTDTAKLFQVMEIASLDAPASLDADQNTIAYHDVIGAEDPGFQEISSDENIDACIKRVAEIFPDEKIKGMWFDYAYMMHFGEPVTQKNLASKYHLSQSYVSRLLIQGKKLLKKYLESDCTR